MTKRVCPHCGASFETQDRAWIHVLVAVAVTFLATAAGAAYVAFSLAPR